MIRKISHFILAILLLVSTMGVTIYTHYSGSRLFSVALFVEAESCCEKECPGCHNESLTIRVKDNFVGSSMDLIDAASFELFFPDKLIGLFTSLKYSHITNLYLADSPPPDLLHSSAFIQNFRL